MFELRPVSPGHPAVEVWSDRRLPYEPKGELLALRTAVGSAVRALDASAGEIIDASYQSSEGGFCDVENVLFYNVGLSSFVAPGTTGVRFQRRFDPPPLAPSGAARRHFVRYERRSDSTRMLPDAVVRLASLPFSSASELHAPWTVWHHFRTGAIELAGRGEIPGLFGVSVQIECSRGTVNPITTMKPLLDGLVAALHFHDGSALDAVSERLTGRLPVTVQEARELLLDEEATPLGQRRLVWPFRGGLQVNPADDRLAAAVVRVTGSSDGRTRVNAEVYPL